MNQMTGGAIAYFPEPYPDELLSSVLMRYHVHSGNITARQSNEALFSGKKKLLDMELPGQLQDGLLERMTEIKPLPAWIEDHTMLAQYTRFLPEGRRERAWEAVLQMDPRAEYLLYRPKLRKDKYLRYCPRCTAEDRDRYGEAYWHRVHQLQGVTVCPEHGVPLIESAVRRDKAESRIEAAAELVIDGEEYEGTETDKKSIEWQLSCYLAEVFRQPVDMNNSVDMADFLQYRMRERYSMGARGGLTDLVRLTDMMQEFYTGIRDYPDDMHAVIKRIQHKISFPHLEICMLGLFLGITPAEIAAPQLPDEERTGAYDVEVKKLYRDGMIFAEIARRTGVEPWRVRDICRDRYGHRGEREIMRKYQKMDRDALDREYCPKVCEIIRQIEYNKGQCPGRVTLNGVATRLGVRNRLLSELPECMTEIKKHERSVGENRARKIAWAAKTVQDGGKILNRQSLWELVHLERKAVVSAISYLDRYVDEETVRRIQELVE